MTSSSTSLAAIQAGADGAIGWVTISNPARRNALSTGMMSLLGESLRELDDNPAVRVIVLRGEGADAFCAGADITEFAAQQDSTQARELADEATARLFAALAVARKPLIAMIHGYCLGAGLALALAADIRIADDGARFAIPAARLGIGYPLALTHALARATGPGLAAEILFTGRTLTADEAFAAGLVNRVLPAAGLEPHTRDLAEAIAGNAPLSVQAAKAAIRSLADPAGEEGARKLIAAAIASADAREGQRAFREKRPPRFTGA